MRLLDLTLPTPAENLALDEALLDEAESAAEPLETLRLWESPRPMVVVGRSSRIDLEVRRETCREFDIPVLRRTSGGAAVVAGPGCLMYSVVLSYRLRPRLRILTEAHRFVLATLAAGLEAIAPGARCRGTSDLALGERKFSGNSVRCRREHFLYHGTLLYDFPLGLIEQCLLIPPRMPGYRERRPHGDFVMNFPADGDAMCRAVVEAWDAREPRGAWPRERVAELVAAKYTRPEWNELGAN